MHAGNCWFPDKDSFIGGGVGLFGTMVLWCREFGVLQKKHSFERKIAIFPKVSIMGLGSLRKGSELEHNPNGQHYQLLTKETK